MKRAFFMIGVLVLGIAATGCDSRTPEEIEAAKFPKVKQNTPEEEKEMRERLHLDKPITGPTGMGVNPAESQGK